MFGVLILLTELKRYPIIKTFQRRVDIYFHLLSVPRGKGLFYCFIGLLAFMALEWSLARICILIVFIVGARTPRRCLRRGGGRPHRLARAGVAHLLSCGGAGEPAESTGKSGLVGSDAASSSAGPSSEAAATFTNFAMNVVKDNPGLLRAGADYATRNPDAAAAVAGNMANPFTDKV